MKGWMSKACATSCVWISGSNESLHGLNLELVAVAMNLLRADRRCHLTPPER
jgi:hypothetical protein